MRGNNVMKGYFDDPEATEKAFRGGWFHSGDLGVMHPDGYVELRDRAKDVVISGGENISTIEVEQAVVLAPRGARGRGDRRARREVGRAAARRSSCSSRAESAEPRGADRARQDEDRPLQGARRASRSSTSCRRPPPARCRSSSCARRSGPRTGSPASAAEHGDRIDTAPGPTNRLALLIVSIATEPDATVAAPGAFRVAAGAVAVTTVSVLPVFLTGALSVQVTAELGFDPSGLGLVVALYFGVSALCSLPVGMIVERVGSRVTSRIAVVGRRGADGRPGARRAVLRLARGDPALRRLVQRDGAAVVEPHAGALGAGRGGWGSRSGSSRPRSRPRRCWPALAVPAVALTVGWRWAYGIGAVLALVALTMTPRANAAPDGGKPATRAAGDRRARR